MNESPLPGMNEVLAATGVKLGFLVAGLAGGIVSLQFIKNLTPVQAIAAVFTSIACSFYFTPALVFQLGITDARLQFSAAFMLGLFAMNIIPAMKAAVPATVRWIIGRFVPGYTGQPVQGDGGDK